MRFNEKDVLFNYHVFVMKAFKIKQSKWRIKQTVPITERIGYIYSSQPIFIVFTSFHVLILRETIISTCSGESLFLSLIKIRTR